MFTINMIVDLCVIVLKYKYIGMDTTSGNGITFEQNGNINLCKKYIGIFQKASKIYKRFISISKHTLKSIYCNDE